jgi:hypothetical protein
VRRVRARSAASRRVQFGSCSWSGFRTKTPTPELQQRDKPCARCLILPCSMSPTPLASLTTAARHEPGSPPGGRRPSLTLLTDFATGRPPPHLSALQAAAGPTRRSVSKGCPLDPLGRPLVRLRNWQVASLGAARAPRGSSTSPWAPRPAASHPLGRNLFGRDALLPVLAPFFEPSLRLSCIQFLASVSVLNLRTCSCWPLRWVASTYHQAAR